jgi:hypothetical protein
MPSITAPRLHRQHCRAEKTSSNVIEDGSASTSKIHAFGTGKAYDAHHVAIIKYIIAFKVYREGKIQIDM